MCYTTLLLRLRYVICLTECCNYISKKGRILTFQLMLWYVHRAGLNDLYAASQKSLDTEQRLRLQLEQELEMQKSVREEKDVRCDFDVTHVMSCDLM